ncbi:unnamed protein product [Trifolium pratense]|uniref:Uncharacterized protein n=1 Tax=Trifolium pratense TaxID=57577 RepID=A0ACB0LUK1_TRIPR|nr:unnamed protein product [Trifolium pratense]
MVAMIQPASILLGLSLHQLKSSTKHKMTASKPSESGHRFGSAHRFHLSVKKESHQFPNAIPSRLSNSFSHPPSRPCPSQSQPPPPPPPPMREWPSERFAGG